MAYFFKIPFAKTGNVTAIPRDEQLDGSVSYEKGFPVDYQLDPNSEPTAKDVPRNQFNELMNNVTGAISTLQVHGFPDFITSSDNDGSPYSYDINATVRFTGGWAGAGALNYYSLADTNTADPTDATKWGLVTYQRYELPGVVKEYYGSTLPTGYVWLNGTTIGSAASGATGRANADTLALYTVLWNSMTNAVLPIQTSGGSPTTRGLSAAADFAADKRLPVPDRRGRVAAGVDTMGGVTAANRITDAGCGIDGAVIGANGGAQNVQLTSAQNGQHSHSASTASAGVHFHNGSTATDGTHTHTVEGANGGVNGAPAYVDLYTGSQTAQPGPPGATWGASGAGGSNDYLGSQTGLQNGLIMRAKGSGSAHQHSLTTSDAGAHTHTVTVADSGSGTAHLNVQPTIMSNFIIALGTT